MIEITGSAISHLETIRRTRFKDEVSAETELLGDGKIMGAW